VAVVRLNPNLEAELTGHLAEHGPMSLLLGEYADEIAQEARRIARAEYYRTGAYLRGIRAEHGLDEHGELVGRVVATDFKSHWAEFGTSRMRARHVLRRAAERVGFRVVGAGVLGSLAGGGGGRRAISGSRRRAISGPVVEGTSRRRGQRAIEPRRR
jgi:hypothetical protein